MLICENNIELFTDTVQMFPYFIWHCSIPYYQANTGYWLCRNGIIVPNCEPTRNSTTSAYKLCNEQMAKTRERCMHRPGECDF